MSVTNYTPDKCKYSIGKLVKSVWLVSEEAIKDIRIDNGEAWVESVSETPIRLDCYSIELTDTDTLDERYKFTHTLTFSVNGYANKDDFQGRYYAIVKDDEGTYWLVNPLFPCKVTYTYTLGNEQNHTDFTMSTASNHPVLKLNGMVDSSTYECNEYWLDGIDALWLNEKRYTVHSGNHVMYTNGGFKTVEYNSKSATFTETFDGTNTSHGIEFDVLFSEYKKSWHYNLLEFKDNLYASVIKTRNNKYALCGFSLGMQPGFQVSANDTNNQIDRIHITLNDAHDVGDTIEMYDSIEYEYLSAKTWVYTDEYDGWECVDEGVARYLLQMEVDALENETGNYKVLDGYSSRFPYLNIVDTFDSTETFENVDCGSSSCRLRSSFPSQLTFNDTGCQTYYVKAGSDWEISSSVDYIRVSPSTGSADESYIVSVCNDIEPSDTVRNSSLTIEYCETSSTVDVSVEQYEGCFTQGSTYNIPANAKVMTLPSDCCINSARETTSAGVSVAVHQDYLQVTIPENNTGAQRTIILLVTYCDGTVENIVINQSSVFERWVAEGFQCFDSDKYKVQRLYTGTTSSSITARTDTVDYILVETQSLECQSSDEWDYEKWEIITNDYFCDNGTKYAKERRYVSNDNVHWTETDTYKKTNTIIEANSPDCGYDPNISGNCTEYRDEGVSICNGYHKYKYLRKYVRDCQNCNNCSSPWIRTNIYSIDEGQVIEYYSSDCGFICIGCTKSWTTSGYTCVGYDKYRVDVMHITHADGSVWVTPTTSTTLVEQGSSYCGCNNPQYAWNKAPVTDYVCDMENNIKYYKEYYQVSCDGTNWENVVPESSRTSSDIIETGSTDCGALQDRWIETDDTICVESGYLTIIPEENCIISKVSYPLSDGNALDYFYSLDSGLTWTSANSRTEIAVDAGKEIMVKGTERPNISLNVYTIGTFNARKINAWYAPAACAVKGNIMSMVLGDECNYKTGPDDDNWGLTGLFGGWINVSNIDNLKLPATKLTPWCYDQLLRGNDITTIPNGFLSAATTLAMGCYDHMFEGCTSLTTVPSNLLPATALADYCYAGMFSGCTSLTSIPGDLLPVTTLANYCYGDMFQGCTSLTSIPGNLLPARVVVSGCYGGMFSGCTSLTSIPSNLLPVTTMGSEIFIGSYVRMFEDCTSLTDVSNLRLPIMTFPNEVGEYMHNNGYSWMFRGCTSLTSAPALPATGLSEYCYYGMFSGCTSLTTAPALPATNLNGANECYAHMFEGCTSLTTAPTLPATTLASLCYSTMFSGCTSLTTVPTLPATTLSDGCYMDMFNGCTNLTTVPSNMLPADTLATRCYDSMFEGCTSLTTAPDLLAAAIADHSYWYMFARCSNLSSIKCLAETGMWEKYASYWVQSVSSSGTFYKKAGVDWPSGVNGIPDGWEIIEM